MKQNIIWNNITEKLPEHGKDYLVWTGSYMLVSNAEVYNKEKMKIHSEWSKDPKLTNGNPEVIEHYRNCKGRFSEFGENYYFDSPRIYWAELPLAPGEENPTIPEPEYDSKDIYMKKDHAIIGLHAVGIAGPYEYDLVGIDGSTTRIKSDFDAIEVWGNEYDEEHNMLGRGSFRLSNDIESEAQYFEKEGWIRCEAPKRKEK